MSRKLEAVDEINLDANMIQIALNPIAWHCETSLARDQQSSLLTVGLSPRSVAAYRDANQPSNGVSSVRRVFAQVLLPRLFSDRIHHNDMIQKGTYFHDITFSSQILERRQY